MSVTGAQRATESRATADAATANRGTQSPALRGAQRVTGLAMPAAFLSGTGASQISGPFIMPGQIPPVPIVEKCFAPGDLLPDDLASKLGQIIETRIDADYCKLMAPCRPMVTDFFDQSGDPLPYISFLVFNNPGHAARLTSLAIRTRIRKAMQVPDMLAHRPERKEFYEVKPDSVKGRAKGGDKLLNLIAFYGTERFPYTPGTSYTPTPEISLGRVNRIEFLIHARVSAPGLILYQLCVRGPVTELALAGVIAALLVLLATRFRVRGVRRVPGAIGP